jgi:TonB family protein
MAHLFPILAGAALKAAAITAIAWTASALMWRCSAARRHMVWLAAAVAVILLPVLTFWIPDLRIAAPFALAGEVARFTATAFGTAAAAPAASSSQTVISPSVHTIRLDWRAALVLLWAAGAALVLLHMLAGYLAVIRLRRSAINRSHHDGIPVFEARAGSMPMTAGILRPAVFLPGAAASWPEDRKRAVLLHEFAHVHRRDAATQAIARLALAMYWWNPLQWIAWREFVKERERAADDFVLTSGVAPVEYAAHLMEIARAAAGALNHQTTLSGAVAMARRSQLEGRLMAILDSTQTRSAAGRRAMWITALCAAAVLIPLAAVHAQDTAGNPADADAAIRSAQAQHDPSTLDQIATAAADRQNFDLARKVLQAALAIRGEASGTSSPEYGQGVLKLANLELRQHGLLSAEALYTQAASLLGTNPASGEVLIKLGEIAMFKKNLDAAAGYFQRAQSQPATAGMASMWLAQVRARQGNKAEADGLFKSAIALTPAGSLDSAVVLRTYSTFLKRQGQTEEADNYMKQSDQIYTSHTARPAHPNTATAGGPYRIGNGVTGPRVLQKQEPQYSDEARLSGLQGTVVLNLVIGVDGYAHDVQVTRSLGLELDDKAVEAVSHWQFAPGTKDGQPVPVFATIEVNFRLL